MSMDLAQRLKLDLAAQPNGCLEWMGSRTRGYGQFTLHGVTYKTHQVAWTLAHGPIPHGQHVLHHCDNPPCCDVTHLFLGTHSQNMQDRAAKGRDNSPNGAKTHCPQGHNYTPANTHTAKTGSRSCKKCHANRARAARAAHTTA